MSKITTALELLCPNCERIVDCKSEKTFPDHSAYKFREFFEELTETESNFRLRSRECQRCFKSFRTVEVDEKVLNLIKGKLESLDKTVNAIETQLNIASSLINQSKNVEEKKLLNDEDSKTERYIKFVFNLFGENLVEESKLKDYFLKNDSKSFIALVEEAIGMLPIRHNKVISMRFGIGSRIKHKRSEIGKRFKLDDKEIQKKEEESFDKLSKAQEKKNLLEFLKDLGLTLR